MNSVKICLIVLLFTGYLFSAFIDFIFPFLDFPFSVIWNAVFYEYLGYTVFVYYTVFMIYPMFNAYIDVQQLLPSINQITYFYNLKADYSNPLIPPLMVLAVYSVNIFYSIFIHKILKKKNCFSFVVK